MTSSLACKSSPMAPGVCILGIVASGVTFLIFIRTSFPSIFLNAWVGFFGYRDTVCPCSLQYQQVLFGHSFAICPTRRQLKHAPRLLNLFLSSSICFLNVPWMLSISIGVGPRMFVLGILRV